jgi:hypothetical protein
MGVARVCLVFAFGSLEPLRFYVFGHGVEMSLSLPLYVMLLTTCFLFLMNVFLFIGTRVD